MAHVSMTVVDRRSCRCVLPGWLSLRCHMASIGWRLPVALGPSSPTTFYPCGLQRPSPDALCVFRRPLEGPEEATPSLRRRAAQARNFHGSPPPASKPQCDTASPKRLPLLEHCSLWYNPSLKKAPQGNESLTD